MSEQKNIDKLFQEKFKDFEAEPPQSTWPGIKSKLTQKEERRIIPFWWKLSGIAAALLIGFLISTKLDSETETEKKVVLDDSKKPGSKNDPPLKSADGGNSIERTMIGAIDSQSSKSKNLNVPAENTNFKSEKKQIFDPENKNKVAAIPNRRRPQQESGNPQSTNGKSRLAAKSEKIHHNNYRGSETLKVTAEEKSLQTVIKEESDSRLVNAKNKNDNTPMKNTPPGELVSGDEAIKHIENISAPVAISEEVQDKKTDSAAAATAVVNTLEELLNEKERNLIAKEPKLNRWQITSNIAPVYFGSTSTGSPIDSTFSGNSKDYETNLSFGLGVNYMVSKKLKVRTGINKVALSYNTNGVVVNAGLQAGSLENVTLSAENQFLTVASTYNAKSTVDITPDATDKFEGYLSQKMGYIEVPLELSYAIINKKFGVDIIGGFSTLFLNENKITVVSSGLSTNLGEANNLNKTHFSSNIGLGLKYEFLKSFQFNFEPTFKYQMNTFSGDSGNFKPYLFGLYTGLSFRF